MASLVKTADLTKTALKYGSEGQAFSGSESNSLAFFEGVQRANDGGLLSAVESNSLVIDTVVDRPEGAGLHLLWGPTNPPSINYTPVRGIFASNTLANSVTNGNYDQPATQFYPTQSFISINAADAATDGPKYYQLYIGDRKPTSWQKHYWYANNAQANDAPRREDPDWIGAWWTQDGLDVMKGCFDLLTYTFFNLMTAAQRSRTIGLRFNYNAISNEGDSPGPTLNDSDHPAWTRGSLASTTRPPDYTSSTKNGILNSLVNYVLDQALPEGDNGDPAFTVFIRPGVTDDTFAATDTRLNNLWANNKAGFIITSYEHQPRSAFHEGQMEDLMFHCKKAGGNERGFMEGFGERTDDSDIEANFSMLQFQYWMFLCGLHTGCTFIGCRTVFADNWNLAAGSLRDEWRASMNFVTKYAGYQQHPSKSPGAWLALREGNRLTGNYTFLATQIITGAGNRGTERWAGTQGAVHNFPSGHYVGPGSNIGYGVDGTDAGQGQRQSAWAFRFTSGQRLKVRFDTTFLNANVGKTVRLNVHYLGIQTGTFTVALFGATLGSPQSVTNTDSWHIRSNEVSDMSISEDADTAHAVIHVTSGTVDFHMVELEIVG